MFGIATMISKFEVSEWTKEQQKANRAKFVKALRSGGYEQSKRFLHTKDGKFSVLGVACDVAIKEGAVSAWVDEGDCYTCCNASFLLPHDVRHWLGFKGRYGRYVLGDEMMFYLGEDNEFGVPCSELADTIESEPKKLIGRDLHDRHRPKY